MWTLYYEVTTGWRVQSETDPQLKEEMWALNHGANKRWRAHSETDSQIKEKMWALHHGVTTGWRLTVRQTHKSRRRCGPCTME